MNDNAKKNIISEELLLELESVLKKIAEVMMNGGCEEAVNFRLQKDRSKVVNFLNQVFTFNFVCTTDNDVKCPSGFNM